MLDKLKGLMDTEEKIREMHGALQKQKGSVQSHTKVLNSLEQKATTLDTQFSRLAKSHGAMQQKIEQQLEQFSSLRASMEGELNEMKLLKSALREKLVREIVGEVREEIVDQMGRLKTDVRSFNGLKTQLEQIQGDLSCIRGEIDKFKRISKHIQEKDFTLSRYAKEVTKNNQEKVQLLKRVDSLQRLIGKERKKRN